MRRPVSTLVLLMTVTAVGVAGSASAGPPTSGTVERTAPYDSADAGGSISGCNAGATCTIEPTADAATGASSTRTTFVREQGATGHETASSFATQVISLKLPRRASEVTATFRWKVDLATADAASGQGVVFAESGLAAFASGCSGGCSTEDVFHQVVRSVSISGTPAQAGGSGAREVVLTLEATGDLPRFLDVVTYPYSIAGARPTQLCPSPESCTTLEERHAGRSTSSISATLTSATVTVG